MDKKESRRMSRIIRLMDKHSVKSIGKDLCGHFSADDVAEIMKTAESRGRKPGQVVVAAVMLGFPAVKEMKAIAPSPLTNKKADAETLEHFKIPPKGKTMCGFFPPEFAVDVLELSEKHDNLPVSQIVKAAMEVGLPLFKKEYPARRALAA
jgi:hypothetical protein